MVISISFTGPSEDKRLVELFRVSDYQYCQLVAVDILCVQRDSHRLQ